ncbi:signal peptidase II [Candidatus Peregrinibacteria bacterium]|jgi:signal peptidase II|nr:signal peptidase II [Candidatus Peregrinibacteria bacterium]MBT7483788.1 signal peptidase II [Candidatus Peregrinibacteria bacterium]MBT7703022.1 signal peptidase II [Candidatus Peregrinibacteria bacterium]
MRRFVSFIALTFLILAVDWTTKLQATSFEGYHSLRFNSWFTIDYVENPGIAFGIPFGGWGQIVVSVVLLLILLAYALTKLDFNQTSVKIFMALILGGALGNLIDRISFGVVRDFIGIGSWPLFNFADAAIVIGIILFLYHSYRYPYE